MIFRASVFYKTFVNMVLIILDLIKNQNKTERTTSIKVICFFFVFLKVFKII